MSLLDLTNLSSYNKNTSVYLSVFYDDLMIIYVL